MSYDYSENILVQEAAGNLLHDHLLKNTCGDHEVKLSNFDDANRKYYSLLLIQNDCETLKQICLSIRNPIFSMGIIPYMALFCRSVQEYLGTELINPEIDSEIYDIRNRIKVYGDKYGKGKKLFLLSDEKQNDEFREKLRFEFTKSLNIHYNLGIYFDNRNHIIGNTQLYADELHLNPLPDRERPQKAFLLGKNLASIIGSISKGFEKTIPVPPILLHSEVPELYYADLNTNTSRFFNDAYEKDVNLFMLHILSNIGFVSYVLEPIAGKNNSWFFRIKYLVTYYSFLGIQRLKQHLENNTQNGEEKLIQTLSQILNSHEYLFSSTFRNCMMHYDLVADGSFAISERFFDSQKPLFGLIEECFNGLSYDDFSNRLSDLSNQIERILASQFSFSSLRVKKL